MLIMQDRKRIIQYKSGQIVWIAIFIVLSHQSQAQKIPFENYTVQDGLPQNTVNDIEQDLYGYIWFATQVGAARYDGYDFEYFNTSNGLPDNFVNCLLVSKKGHVWMGTEGGVAEFKGYETTIYTTQDGMMDNRIDNMVEDLEGNIWIASAYGLSVITGDSIITYTRDDALTDNSIKDMYTDSHGRVHVTTYPKSGLTIFEDPYHYKKSIYDEVIWDILETGTGEFWYATQGNGILVTDDKGERWLGYGNGLTDEIVLSLHQDSKGRIWCGTYVEGLFIYEEGQFRNYETGYSNEPIAAEIIEDGKGRIWIRTFNNGIWICDDGAFRHITSENDLVDDVVNDLCEDKYGNIWLATVDGASKYGKVIFEIMDTDHGLPENHVTSILYDSRGRLWCGSYGHLLYLYRNRTYILDEHVGFPEGAIPLSFAEGTGNEIYIGTDVGLLRFSGRSIIPIDFWGQDTESPQFFSLISTEEGSLWCGTDLGLFVLKERELSSITLPGDDAVPWVNALDMVGDKIYCGTKEGILVFDREGNLLEKFTRDDGLASDVCKDVTHDEAGNVWIGSDRGLSVISPGHGNKIESLGTEQGLTSNTIYFVEFNDSTSLWIGTERGVNKLDISNRQIAYYGYEDGFHPLETNARAVSKGEGKELWMGTIAGLVHYKPKYDQRNLTPPDLILFPPVVQGETYSEKEGNTEGVAVFPYSRNSVVFSYTGIHTTIPSRNRFSYFLEGFDDDWSDKGTDRSVSYRKIPNGNYVFRVKAYNLDGVETEQDSSFAFTIKPPFWKTIWFIMFEVLAALSLVYGTIKYRERQLIREKRILETRVKERTREIEDQKVEIEAQRDEIAEQKGFVEEQRDQIAFQNKEITDSILYAKRIQQAVLPGKYKLEQTLPEHFILFKPRDIVSGDFYWVEQKHDRIIVCVADCTGHGVPGAFMSMLGLTFLNEIVNKDEIIKASDILNRLRSYIITALSHHEEGSETRDGMDISLVVFDKQLNILEYSGAYNPLVLFRNGEIIEYKADKMPIGKHVGEEGKFTNHKIMLQDRDMIYLFSDGFADQFGGDKGSKYKARPFKRFLQKICDEPVKKQVDMLEKELKSWMGSNEQVDDILVLGIRYYTDR